MEQDIKLHHCCKIQNNHHFRYPNDILWSPDVCTNKLLMSRLPYLKINNDNIEHNRYNTTYGEGYNDNSKHTPWIVLLCWVLCACTDFTSLHQRPEYQMEGDIPTDPLEKQECNGKWEWRDVAEIGNDNSYLLETHLLLSNWYQNLFWN